MKTLALAALALAGAAVAGVVAHASADKTTVTVTEKEFHIALTAKKAAVGPVKFVVKNTGKYPHALAISGPGVKQRKTPTIKPGTSATLVVTLKAGKYSLWCPIPGHAAQGMKASILVGAAAAGGATSTSSGGGGYGGGTTTGTSTDTVPWG